MVDVRVGRQPPRNPPGRRSSWRCTGWPHRGGRPWPTGSLARWATVWRPGKQAWLLSALSSTASLAVGRWAPPRCWRAPAAATAGLWRTGVGCWSASGRPPLASGGGRPNPSHCPRTARHRQPQGQPDGGAGGRRPPDLATLWMRPGRRSWRSRAAGRDTMTELRNLLGVLAPRRRTGARPKWLLGAVAAAARPARGPDRVRRAAGRGADLRRAARRCRPGSTSPRTGSSRRR